MFPQSWEIYISSSAELQIYKLGHKKYHDEKSGFFKHIKNSG